MICQNAGIFSLKIWSIKRMARILITGISNSGKTSLLKTLKDVLVVSRDGKPFSLELPHFNAPDFDRVNDILDLLVEKLNVYKDKFGKYPKTIAFDSVSRIFTDIETNCSRKYKGFEVWSNVNKEVNTLVDAINQIEREGYNIILIAHCVWDEKAGKYIETCKGSFAKIGGFLSICDYAINIDRIGKTFTIHNKNNNLARTLLTDIPDKQDSTTFNLQEYLDKIVNKTNTVTKEWSI